MAHKLGPVFTRVVEHFSTKTALGVAVGLDRRTIDNWSVNGWIPADYAFKVSAATGGRFTIHELLAEAALGMERRKARREMLKELAAAKEKADQPGGA